MFNPVHKIKKFVKNPDGSSYWYEDTIHGWLVTGLIDCNGREIIEGDKALVADSEYGEIETVVEFRDSQFVVFDDYPLSAVEALDITVVGHISEDEQ